MPFTAAQQNLIDWVEARIDEITPEEQSPTIGHEQLYTELQQAAYMTLRRARTQIVYEAIEDGSGGSTSADGDSTVIQLPSDFLRFIRVRLDTWDKPVDQLVPPDSNAYRQQHNAYQQGTAGRPMAAIIPKLGGGSKIAVQCWPSGSVTELLYVPQLVPEDVPGVLEDPMIWYAAGRALQAIRNSAYQAAYQAANDSLSALQLGVLGEAQAGPTTQEV